MLVLVTLWVQAASVPPISEAVAWRWLATIAFTGATGGLGFGVRRVLTQLDAMGARMDGRLDAVAATAVATAASLAAVAEQRHERIFARLHEWNNKHQSYGTAMEIRLARIEDKLGTLPCPPDATGDCK